MLASEGKTLALKAGTHCVVFCSVAVTNLRLAVAMQPAHSAPIKMGVLGVLVELEAVPCCACAGALAVWVLGNGLWAFEVSVWVCD